MTPALLALTVADTPSSWLGAGFTVDASDHCGIGSVDIELHPDPACQGVTGFAFEGSTVGQLDGLAVTAPVDVERQHAAPHANGVLSIDHLVVTTPDLDRTIAALAAAGFELRRTRDGTAYGGEAVRQAFFRMGEVVLEVVGPPTATGSGPARFFGLACTVADLDATAAHLGEHLGAAKDAVQPGRRIATLRRSAGLTTAVAFMTPDLRG